MATKAATAAVLSGLSDVIAQLIEGTAIPSLAPGRCVALILVNIFYITPLLSAMYDANEWLAADVLQLPADTWRGSVVRLSVDQLLYAPPVIYGFFWAYGMAEAIVAWVLGGTPLIWSAIRAKLWSQIALEYRGMLVSNWKLWVAPQLLSFRLLPPALRLPFGSLVAFGWGVIQSLIINR